LVWNLDHNVDLEETDLTVSLFEVPV